jgi:hypothetical protein
VAAIIYLRGKNARGLGMSMTNILLIGARFSRNWNAPLASEVASSLLQAVGSDPDLQALLKQHEKNFENARSEIQRQYLAVPTSPKIKARLNKLQGVQPLQAQGGAADE